MLGDPEEEPQEHVRAAPEHHERNAGPEPVNPFEPARAQEFVDWLNTPADALVTRKDPLAYLRRLDFYAAEGAALFA